MGQALLYGLLFALFSIDVFALEVKVQSSLKTVAENDDNTKMSITDPESLFGLIVTPRATIEINTETIKTKVDVKLDFNEYNKEAYNRDDQELVVATKKNFENFFFGLTGGAVRSNTRISEEIDSGRFENSRRENYYLAPSWQYAFSRRQSVSLSGRYEASNYDSDRYTGYENWSNVAQWSYDYQENLTFTVQYNLSDYGSDDRAQAFTFVKLVDIGGELLPQQTLVRQKYATNSSTDGFQIAANYRLLEKLALYGAFGGSKSENKYSVKDDSEVCQLSQNDPRYISRGACDLESQSSRTKTIDTSVSWREEYNEFTLAYSNTNKPSSDGYLIESEQIRLNWQYAINERDSLLMEALWLENNTLDIPNEQIGTASSDRTYYAVSLKYTYRLMKKVYINTQVRYRYQKRRSVNNAADSNSLIIGITYRPSVKLF